MGHDGCDGAILGYGDGDERLIDSSSTSLTWGLSLAPWLWLKAPHSKSNNYKDFLFFQMMVIIMSSTMLLLLMLLLTIMPLMMREMLSMMVMMMMMMSPGVAVREDDSEQAANFARRHARRRDVRLPCVRHAGDLRQGQRPQQ